MVSTIPSFFLEKCGILDVTFLQTPPKLRKRTTRTSPDGNAKQPKPKLASTHALLLSSHSITWLHNCQNNFLRVRRPAHVNPSTQRRNESRTRSPPAWANIRSPLSLTARSVPSAKKLAPFPIFLLSSFPLFSYYRFPLLHSLYLRPTK